MFFALSDQCSMERPGNVRQTLPGSSTFSLESSTFLCSIFLRVLVIFLLWIDKIEFSQCQRRPESITVMLHLFDTLLNNVQFSHSNPYRILSPSKITNAAKSLPILFCFSARLVIDGGLGLLKFLFSVLRLNGSFSEVLCSHF